MSKLTGENQIRLLSIPTLASGSWGMSSMLEHIRSLQNRINPSPMEKGLLRMNKYFNLPLMIGVTGIGTAGLIAPKIFMTKPKKEIIIMKKEAVLQEAYDSAFNDELEKIAKKKMTHPVSEAQRKWAFAAEERGQLPKGKAHTWARRVEGEDLPSHT